MLMAIMTVLGALCVSAHGHNDSARCPLPFVLVLMAIMTVLGALCVSAHGHNGSARCPLR